jgi:hypothetical protein
MNAANWLVMIALTVGCAALSTLPLTTHQSIASDLMLRCDARWAQLTSQLDPNVNPKSRWSELMSAGHRLAQELTTDEVREALLLRPQQGSGAWIAWSFEGLLIRALASGQSDAVEAALLFDAGGRLHSPLVILLHEHDIRRGPGSGVELLFDAYARATGENRIALREAFWSFEFLASQANKDLASESTIRWLRDWYVKNRQQLLGNFEMSVGGWDSSVDAPVLLFPDQYIKRCRLDGAIDERSWILRTAQTSLSRCSASLLGLQVLPEWHEAVSSRIRSGEKLSVLCTNPTLVGRCGPEEYIFDIDIMVHGSSQPVESWGARVRIYSLGRYVELIGLAPEK